MEDPDGTLTYLAYGSNLHPHRLEERIGAVECLGQCRVPGFLFRFNKRGRDGSAKANLVAAPGADAEAWGALYHMPATVRPGLDRYETLGRGYELAEVEVRIDGGTRRAITYLAPPTWQCADDLPFDWYHALVLAGARYHRFPEGYVRELAAVAVKPDLDPARAMTHKTLLARLEA